MKAMILAAGRGERLRPMTDHTPKPLLKIGGTSLIERHLLALRCAGITEVVINAAWRAGDIQASLGDGSAYGMRIHYSVEQHGGLDTGGGVRAALPLLGESPFVLVSADVYTDFDYTVLRAGQSPVDDAHVVLVPNPPHHPEGDFGLVQGRLSHAAPRYTYAGIGVYTPRQFADVKQMRFSLAAVIRAALERGRARGLHYDGLWLDVGRPATLAYARKLAARRE